MGVVDVLPHYLSSVYLFWDPGLPQLALGKVTAMFEIAWVQRAVRHNPDLRFYCMGAHAHTAAASCLQDAALCASLACSARMNIACRVPGVQVCALWQLISFQRSAVLRRLLHPPEPKDAVQGRVPARTAAVPPHAALVRPGGCMQPAGRSSLCGAGRS